MKSSVGCGNDELFSIFQFLDPQSILNSCVRVSQRWKQVACCNALWKYFCNSILMNDVFEWNLELERYGSYYQNDGWNDVHNDGNQMDDYYWYNVFHYIMFRIPIFKSCSIECSSNWNSWTQLEEYYDFLVPPSSYEWLERMKTPQHGNNVVEEYSVQQQDEHEYSRQILSTNEFDRYQISQQYVLAKIAALLTILSSGSHCTPNPWNDKLFLSLFEFDDKNNTWQVKRTTTISVAAFCVCQMFPGLGTMKLRQLVTSRSPQSNNLLMSIAPPIEDSSHVKPFCFFEYMDQYFETAWNEHDTVQQLENPETIVNSSSEVIKTAQFCWYDSWDDRYEHFFWLPILFNAGGRLRTYKFKSIYLEQNLMRIEKHYEIDYA